MPATYVHVESLHYLFLLQTEKHNVDGRDLEVKAARPKALGGSTRASKKLFVGGLPVCSFES
jgi:hypothetical protein